MSWETVDIMGVEEQGWRREPKDAWPRFRGKKAIISFDTGEENGEREPYFGKRTLAASPKPFWPSLDCRFPDVVHLAVCLIPPSTADGNLDCISRLCCPRGSRQTAG